MTGLIVPPHRVGLPKLVEPQPEQFHSALEVTLQDAFGVDCLEERSIEPDAELVRVHVDSHVAEVDLKKLVRRLECRSHIHTHTHYYQSYHSVLAMASKPSMACQTVVNPSGENCCATTTFVFVGGAVSITR